VKTFAVLAAVLFLALGAAGCGGGGSATIAKVGSQPITKKQLDAVLVYDRGQYRKLHRTFPRAGSAEYVLLRQQAVAFLVEQSRANQADAKVGAKPADRVVSDAAFRTVTANVHITDADVERYFRSHPTGRPLDHAAASDIRRELLKQRRATIMHGFVAAARRYTVTYAPGYAPVSASALAERIWTVHVVSKLCDLPPGMYSYPEAVRARLREADRAVHPRRGPAVPARRSARGGQRLHEHDGERRVRGLRHEQRRHLCRRPSRCVRRDHAGAEPDAGHGFLPSP
jgi:hypothetical protein